MSRSIIFVHGRSFKPPKQDLWRLWNAALQYGIERDRPGMLRRYKNAKKSLVYFGDISNSFLRSKGHKYNAKSDVKSRKETLAALTAYSKAQFTKANYKKLPGKNSYKEFLAEQHA